MNREQKETTEDLAGEGASKSWCVGTGVWKNCCNYYDVFLLAAGMLLD
jgi:hypothetical protein